MKIKNLNFVKLLFAFLCYAIHTQAQTYTFPLKVSENKRFISDQTGKPFLYVSDAAWQLFMGLPLSEVKEYLTLRKKQGFSVIHVQLTFQPVPDAENIEGQLPFENYDFAKPNERYFQHIDKIIALADSMNMVMAIVPLWYSCCNDGWGSNPVPHLKNNGLEKCTNFGKFVGNRYKKHNNIIWIMGGDNDPHDQKAEIRGLAMGLKEAAPQHLITYHAASTHSSTDVWQQESWLDMSMIYTYFRGFAKAWHGVQPDVYEVAYNEYLKKRMPFVLGESTYEGEHNDVCNSTLQARKQAYYTMLAGGCGHSYGSRFWAVGYKKWKNFEDWKAIVNQPAANSMRYLNQLFATFDWTSLIPDITSELISGENKYASNDYALAAYTQDRKFAVIYVPSPRKFEVNFNVLNAKKIQATWYNPHNGERKIIGKYAQNTKIAFELPDANDWVLLLENIK